MKPNYLPRTLLLLFIVLSAGFSACVKDTCKQSHSYTYFVPVYRTLEQVRQNIKSNAARTIENTGKIYKYGNFIFLNELDKGVHVIDNTNPSQPRNAAFIDIPGNVDIAVKNGILYADLYTDLVAIDITNPENIVVKKIIDGVFPARVYSNGFVPNSNGNYLITEWIKKDTTVVTGCDQMNVWMDSMQSAVFFSNSGAQTANAVSSPIGAGGSMARFTLMNDRLYTVGHSDLSVFNVANPSDPVPSNTITLPWGIETIYPFGNKLFIGSVAGMYIYDVSSPDAPAAAGEFQHVRSCDPVIADNQHAYITLRSGSACQGFTNQLEVVKLNNFTNAELVKAYPMTNPHGLSKSGNTLFICDGAAGLKIYNSSDVNNLTLLQTISNIETYDVIAQNNIALVVAKDGLYQYDYSNLSNVSLLSKLSVQ